MAGEAAVAAREIGARVAVDARAVIFAPDGERLKAAGRELVAGAAIDRSLAFLLELGRVIDVRVTLPPTPHQNDYEQAGH